jgi:hypothetical protein
MCASWRANRVATFNLGFLTDQESNAWVRDFVLTVGKHYSWVLVPEANLPYQNNGALLGSFVEVPETTSGKVDIRSQTYQIEEML